MHKQRIKELQHERGLLVYDFDKVKPEDQPRYWTIYGQLIELERMQNEVTTCEHSGVSFNHRGQLERTK